MMWIALGLAALVCLGLLLEFLARGAGILRITEAAIVNGKSGEIGIVGERIFSRHLPEAVNCNLSVKHANPDYDFVLNGCTIDVKTSVGIKLVNGKRKFKFKAPNKFKVDLYVLIVKADADAANDDESAFTHCFIIPSLFLLNHNRVEIMSEVVTDGKKMAWSEYLFPIEAMRDNIMMLTANREMLAIPDELKECAELNQEIKKGVRNGK